jgi:hypothetical protein
MSNADGEFNLNKISKELKNKFGSYKEKPCLSTLLGSKLSGDGSPRHDISGILR